MIFKLYPIKTKKWFIVYGMSNVITTILDSIGSIRKPVIYAVHGFGVRRTDEFIPLKIYFESHGYQVITPVLFDQTDLNDIDAKMWIRRAEDGLAQLLRQKRRVWLVGFSMGGVIAAHLARILPVERLVLLAPAFEYITVKTVTDAAEGIARQIIRRPKQSVSEYAPLPDEFSSVFRIVISECKDDIAFVHCPVLIFHGTADETIPVRSSEGAYLKIPHSDKRLFVIQDVPHRILDEPNVNQDVLKLIHDFFMKNLVNAQTDRLEVE